MQILKETSIDWPEKRLILNCTWVRVLSTAGQIRDEVWRWEEELDKDAVCRRFYSAFTTSTVPRMPLKDLETSEEVDK